MFKRSNEQKLKEILDYLTRDKDFQGPLREANIREIWMQEMSEYIIKNTSMIRLRGHILEIGISSAALRNEMAYSKNKITSFLNEKLGEEVIKEVIIRG